MHLIKVTMFFLATSHGFSIDESLIERLDSLSEEEVAQAYKTVQELVQGLAEVWDLTGVDEEEMGRELFHFSVGSGNWFDEQKAA